MIKGSNMKRLIAFSLMIALMLAMLTLAGCGTEEVLIKGNTIKVEIADSDSERQQGLMFREYMPEDHGMLFIFEEEGMKGFWMKNTLISLDMIFIGADGVITDIHQADPCTTEICPVYSAKAKYVLEMNKHYSVRRDIIVGDKVESGIIGSS